MKVKSKKIVSKRFTITASGKLKHTVGQWNHLRMKKATKVHQRKRGSRILTNKTQVRNLMSLMPKPKK